MIEIKKDIKLELRNRFAQLNYYIMSFEDFLLRHFTQKPILNKWKCFSGLDGMNKLLKFKE